MTIAPTYALSIAAGTTGASHTADSAQSNDFLAGQPLWLSCFYKATRTTGSGILTLRAAVRWWDAAGTELTSTYADISINASVGETFHEKKHTAPATAVKCAIRFVATPAASPMQHNLEVFKVRLGRTQVAADITANITGPSSANFAHSSAGVAESGQFPRNLAYSFIISGSAVASGLTWTYLVKSGTVNGFTNASGAQSISGSGSVNFTVSSLGSASAVVDITAAYLGVSYLYTVTLTKDFAAPAVPPPSGGSSGSSMTSGFDTSHATISTWKTIAGDTVGALSATLGAGKTAADIAVLLNITSLLASPNGANNLEMRLQRKIAGTYTTILTTQNSDPDPSVLFNSETSTYEQGVIGQLSRTFNDTGLTASATYEYRIQVQYTTGSANHAPFSFTGSVVVSVP